MDPCKSRALRFYRPKLLECLIVRHFLALAHEDAGGFLNNREEQDVRAVSNHSFDQADLFISFLLTKDNAAFEKFCNILEKFGHMVWSQRLRDKAADADGKSSLCG